MIEKFDIEEHGDGRYSITVDGTVYEAAPETLGCEGCAFINDDESCFRSYCYPGNGLQPLTETVIWVKVATIEFIDQKKD